MNAEFFKEKISKKFSTQEEFAKSLGTSRRTLQNWISQRSIPGDKIFRVLDALDLSEQDEEILLEIPQTQVLFRGKHTGKAPKELGEACKKLSESFLKLPSNAYKINKAIPVLPRPDSEGLVVGSIREILGLDESSPVTLDDVFEKLKSHNVRIIFFPFDRIGIDVDKQRRQVAFTAFSGLRQIIFLDIHRTRDEVLFDVIHELAHIVCGHLSDKVTDEDEKFCNSIAGELIYPQIFFSKNKELIESLKSSKNESYKQVKEIVCQLNKDFDWCAMGLALALKSHGLIKDKSTPFKRLMKINNQMKKSNPKLSEIFFEKFDPSNYDSMKSFFGENLSKDKKIFNGFISLKHGATYGHISSRKLSEILGMNRGDADELVKSWAMEDSES